MQTDTDSLVSTFRKWQKRQRFRNQLIESGLKPKILRFEAGNIVLVENGKIRLSWEVENAHRITINNGVGEVQAKGEMYVRVPEKATNYKIQVKGGKHKIKQSIQIFPEKFNAEPLSQLFSAPTKKGFDFPRLEIDSPKLEKEKINYEQLSTLPELNLPLVPTKTELQRFKLELPESEKLKMVAELQRKFKELKEKDLLENLVD